MENNTLLIAGAVGLGLVYMMNQNKNQQNAQQQMALQQQLMLAQQAIQRQQQLPALPNGYAYQKTSTGTKIVNTINTGMDIINASKSAWDSISSMFGSVPEGQVYMPQVMPKYV